MVRIEVLDERKIKGILIDGHFPDYSFLKQMDWEKAIEEKLSWNNEEIEYFWSYTYDKYLRLDRDIPSIFIQTRLYRDLIGDVRSRSCRNETKACLQFRHSARGNKRIEADIKRMGKRVKDYLPVFSKEIEHDIANGGENYFFNMAVLDLRPGKECSEFERCNNHWMKFLNFKIKEEKDYLDFPKYKTAAEAFIQRYIDFAHDYQRFDQKR